MTNLTLIDTIIEQCKKNIDISHEALHSFRQILLTEMNQEVLLHTLEYLIQQQANNQLNLIVDIISRSGQIWCLNSAALTYFQTLRTSSELQFRNLLNDIKTKISPKERHLALKAHHIESVIDILQIQRQFQTDGASLDNLLSKLDNHLQRASFDINHIIATLRNIHLPFIEQQAAELHLTHHTLKHAFEMRVRTTFLLQEVLGIFANQSTLDIFLSHIIQFAIECHDYEQRNKDVFASVEEYTAHKVSLWLIEAFFRDTDDKELKEFITYIVRYIIVLGTTMIYSPTQTLDLLELFHCFENNHHHANHPFLHNIKQVAIITSVCDKVPAAIYPVVAQQMHYPPTHSLNQLRHYQKIRNQNNDHHSAPLRNHQARNERASDAISSSQGELILDGFFKQLIPYYPLQKNDCINEQGFLISIVPHICMRIELSFATDSEHAAQAMAFIAQAQRNHVFMNDEEFISHFDSQFAQHQLFETVSQLFFASIEKEMNFCRSQNSTLHFAASQLRHTLVDIYPDFSNIDALNLEKLAGYFEQLDVENRTRLVKELLLNTVLQAGACYPNTLQKPSLFKQRLSNALRLSQYPQAFFGTISSSSHDTNNDSTEGLTSESSCSST